MPPTIPQFRRIVLSYYRKEGRHTLPWRRSRTPYRVLVSEVMLQQTQVERVIPYFREWMKKYPTVRALADAPLSDVLRSWQGLGYNRRAKMLHDAAKVIMKQHGGKVPRTVEELEALPGVGPYTARAIAAFAYDENVVFIETNLRTAVIHHFFADRSGIPDSEVLAVLEKALPKNSRANSRVLGSREWYAALMDYGAHLKRSGVRINAKSKGYVKQAAFKGSGREARGAILRAAAAKPTSKAALLKLFPEKRKLQVEEQLEKLVREGLVEKTRSTYRLPS